MFKYLFKNHIKKFTILFEKVVIRKKIKIKIIRNLFAFNIKEC